MFLFIPGESRIGNRKRSKKHRSKLKAKQRRRVNRAQGKRLSRRGHAHK